MLRLGNGDAARYVRSRQAKESVLRAAADEKTIASMRESSE